MMASNPDAAIDREKYMSLDETQTLRTIAEAECIKDLHYGRRQHVVTWAIVDCVLQTGLRVSELVRLNVGDFNPKRGSLRVVRSKKKVAKPETLAIPPDLAEHLAKFIVWKSDVGEKVTPKAALFCSKQGGRFTTRGLQHVWTRCVEAAGLPDFSIHSARHTLAVHLLKKTGNLRQVQKQLGHSSPVTTAAMYADVSFEHMKEGVTGLYD